MYITNEERNEEEATETSVKRSNFNEEAEDADSKQYIGISWRGEHGRGGVGNVS